MLLSRGFFDLCVSQKVFEGQNAETTLELLYDYGYRTIAINHEVKEASDENENKKKERKGQAKKNTELIPEPIQIKKPEKFESLTILKRLTVSFSSSDSYSKMSKSANFKKYDILALLPTNVPALSFACSSIDADILTMDPMQFNQLRINRKTYNQLVNKGYFFEILYGPTIEDPTKRKNTICRSHLYHVFGKSKNIIISSGATDNYHIRSPYDVINLGPLFGLNSQLSKDSITHCPAYLCKKALGRCYGKTIMIVENLTKDDSVILIDDNLDDNVVPSSKRKKK